MTEESTGEVRGNIRQAIESLCNSLSLLDETEQVSALNEIRMALHAISPFQSEPVDCILWVPSGQVGGNDYNPNVVATPEMRLLERSIAEEGYTQPIVAFQEDNTNRFEVVDGFHRNRIGKESPRVRKRVKGYLPVTVINSHRSDRSSRIIATIRHNVARGKHQVLPMREIVRELSERDWTEEQIGRELGIEPEEVSRLKQVNDLEESHR